MLDINKLPHQKHNEKTRLFLRRHWIIEVRHLFYLLVMVSVGLGSLWFIRANFPALLIGSVSGPLIILLASIYFLYVWLLYFVALVDYYLDIWIVTNERIISIEQKGLFSRVIAEQRLYRVQDVTSEIKGFLGMVFNYGNIYVQTAGGQQRFIFKNVGQAETISRDIMRIIEENRRVHEIEIAEERAQEIDESLGDDFKRLKL